MRRTFDDYLEMAVNANDYEDPMDVEERNRPPGRKQNGPRDVRNLAKEIEPMIDEKLQNKDYTIKRDADAEFANNRYFKVSFIASELHQKLSHILDNWHNEYDDERWLLINDTVEHLRKNFGKTGWTDVWLNTSRTAQSGQGEYTFTLEKKVK